MRSTFTLGIVLTIDVEGTLYSLSWLLLSCTHADGGHYFVVVKAASEKSVFGASLSEIECVDDSGLNIPAVLVVMKRYLYDNQGLTQEGALSVTCLCYVCVCVTMSNTQACTLGGWLISCGSVWFV